MSKEEIDIDKEVEKLSRKSNVGMKKSEYSFENQIKRLDKDIDKIISGKLKDFDNIMKLRQDYLNIDYKDSTIDRYREKLKRI